MSIFSSYYMPLVLFVLVSFMFIIVLTVGNITINTMIQKIVPKELLARVVTVISTIGGGVVPLGQGLLGVLSDKYGHMVPMILCTIILFIVGFYSYIIFGKLKFDDTITEKTA